MTWLGYNVDRPAASQPQRLSSRLIVEGERCERRAIAPSLQPITGLACIKARSYHSNVGSRLSCNTSLFNGNVAPGF